MSEMTALGYKVQCVCVCRSGGSGEGLASRFLPVELYKWGSIPLRAYRERVKSINVKQAVTGQIIGAPG